MKGNVPKTPGARVVEVGQKVVRECFKCGTGAGQAESLVPTIVLQKWICVSCGTLNQYEIQFRKSSR